MKCKEATELQQLNILTNQRVRKPGLKVGKM